MPKKVNIKNIKWNEFIINIKNNNVFTIGILLEVPTNSLENDFVSRSIDHFISGMPLRSISGMSCARKLVFSLGVLLFAFKYSGTFFLK